MTFSSFMKKKTTPFFFLLIGFFILVFTGQEIVAGFCMVLGLTMIIDWFFPDKDNKSDDQNKKP